MSINKMAATLYALYKPQSKQDTLYAASSSISVFNK